MREARLVPVGMGTQIRVSEPLVASLLNDRWYLQVFVRTRIGSNAYSRVH